MKMDSVVRGSDVRDCHTHEHGAVAVRSVRRCLCNWRLCPQTVSVLEPCDARQDLNVSRTSAKRMASRNK